MTYSRVQLLTHVHFTVLYGKACIPKSMKLESFINHFLRSKFHQPILTYVLKDHIHCLFFLNPDTSFTESINELMLSIRAEINRNPDNKNFVWDPCYYASSCSIQDIERIISELTRQDEFHNRFTYKDEQNKLLEDMLIAEIFAEEYQQ